MSKKVIISEKAFRNAILNEELDKEDVIDMLKNDRETKKHIKAIVTNTITDLFRVLWQKKSAYENDLKQ